MRVRLGVGHQPDMSRRLAVTRIGWPAAKRAAPTCPRRCAAARSGRAGRRREAKGLRSGNSVLQQREERPRRLERAALRARRRRLRRPAVDVDVQVARARGDEAAQEERGGDRPGHAARGGVVEVGDAGLDQRLVGVPEGQPPQRIGDAGGGGGEVRRQRVVVGEEGRHVRPERHPRGAGQGGEADDEVGRLLVGERQRVGEHQPALGVGVVDLDGQPLAARQDVARPHRRAGDRVLHRRHQEAQAHVEPEPHHHVGEAHGGGRPAHVLLHQPHGGGRLDVEPAGVEADALADQRHLRRVLAAPDEVEEPRRLGGGGANRLDHRQVRRLERRRPARHRDLRPVPRAERHEGGLERLRPHVAGGGVDQVLRQRRRRGDPCEPRAVHPFRADELDLGRLGLPGSARSGSRRGASPAPPARRRPRRPRARARSAPPAASPPPPRAGSGRAAAWRRRPSRPAPRRGPRPAPAGRPPRRASPRSPWPRPRRAWRRPGRRASRQGRRTR